MGFLHTELAPEVSGRCTTKLLLFRTLEVPHEWAPTMCRGAISQKFKSPAIPGGSAEAQ